MGFGTIESRFLWVFGTAQAAGPVNSGPGGANNVLASTGAGVAFNTHNRGERFTFYVEADAAATGAYQLRSARTSSGPWNIISSGTLSTSGVDVVNVTGPLGWLSPRLKTFNSTANQIVVRMLAL